MSDIISINESIIQQIDANITWHYHIIPKEFSEESILFYIDKNKFSNTVSEELEILFGKQIRFEKLETDVILKTLGFYYRKTNDSQNDFSLNGKIDFVDKLIKEANQLNSSDIHIEIYKDNARIRMRVDGMLIQRFSIDKKDFPELINKIKIKSNLDISEKRLPQDGRIQYDNFDIRVSILPTLYGEKIVLRLLGKDATNLNLDSIGLNGINKTNYINGIDKTNGLVLISGPTGSGKTTTLYSTLKILNNEKRNILTIEDPIEYTLNGINQVQLRDEIGLSFASALKSFLRQDPDIIMLGEIRDNETAQMAIRASLTGHLVLSTIHTNSAWGTISRLLEMGIPAFLLASTLNTSVAQRLVRKLCNDCKVIDNEKIKEINAIEQNLYKSNGCNKCHFTGYKGRIAIYEVIPINDFFADCIKNNINPSKNDFLSQNIYSLKEQAIEIVKSGTTSYEEIKSIIL
jgi:type II secretory ATPase GspE/PulE/Tfp pilus assembly ATPase PilB-like protein